MFTGQFFMLYPDHVSDFNVVSNVASLVGAFVCTLGVAIFCDMYDNYDYMTKAKLCMYTTAVSIPSCCLMYMCTDNFYISATGLFVETMLSSAWSQPAIGILAMVCKASIRGTAVSLFFFLLTVFGIIAPMGYGGLRNYYVLDPEHEPYEFGLFVSACTCIPCLLAIPAFYVAGVHYSWKKYHECMFVMDVWNEMEQ